MIKAVIFDMDGTLLDTEKYLVDYWVRAGHDCGVEQMTREDGLLLRSFAAKFAAPYMKEKLGESFDYQKVHARRVELMDAAGLKIEKKPGVDETLEKLHEMGIKVAVATASNPDRTRRLLETVGIYEKFSHIICATTLENGKPMPDVYQYAALQLGENPGDCLAVEDSPNGVKAAFRAGCKTVMIPDQTEPEPELMEYIHGVARSMYEIPEWVRRFA